MRLITDTLHHGMKHGRLAIWYCTSCHVRFTVEHLFLCKHHSSIRIRNEATHWFQSNVLSGKGRDIRRLGKGTQWDKRLSGRPDLMSDDILAVADTSYLRLMSDFHLCTVPSDVSLGGDREGGGDVGRRSIIGDGKRGGDDKSEDMKVKLFIQSRHGREWIAQRRSRRIAVAIGLFDDKVALRSMKNWEWQRGERAMDVWLEKENEKVKDPPMSGNPVSGLRSWMIAVAMKLWSVSKNYRQVRDSDDINEISELVV